MDRLIKIIALLILWVSPVYAAVTIDDQLKILNETTQLCSKFYVKCEAQLLDLDIPHARSVAGKTIQVTTGMGELLNKDEYRSVVYHELGHVALRHSMRQAIYVTNSMRNGTFDKVYWSKMRHKHELEADKFAVLLAQFLKHNNSLDTALEKLVPVQDRNKESLYHPSTTLRILLIRHYDVQQPR